MNILPPKTHVIVKCRFILPGGRLFFKLSPSPWFPKSFKGIPPDSKWHRFCWSDRLCEFLWVIIFVFFMSMFLRYICVVWNVNCVVLPCYWFCNVITFVMWGPFSCRSCHPASLGPPHHHFKHSLSLCLLSATPILAPWGRCRAEGDLLSLAADPTRVGAGNEFTFLVPQPSDSLREILEGRPHQAWFIDN